MLENYINKAKKKQNASQNKLASLIGISGASLSKIVNGGPASNETIVKIAKLAGEKPEKVLAEYELTKSCTPEVKRMWERIAATAASVFFALPIAKISEQLYILC